MKESCYGLVCGRTRRLYLHAYLELLNSCLYEKIGLKPLVVLFLLIVLNLLNPRSYSLGSVLLVNS